MCKCVRVWVRVRLFTFPATSTGVGDGVVCAVLVASALVTDTTPIIDMALSVLDGVSTPPLRCGVLATTSGCAVVVRSVVTLVVVVVVGVAVAVAVVVVVGVIFAGDTVAVVGDVVAAGATAGATNVDVDGKCSSIDCD